MKVDLEKVKKACRVYYRNKLLLAQRSDADEYGYRIIDESDGKDYRCAIGTVLDEETLEKIDLGYLHEITIEDAENALDGIIAYDPLEKEQLVSIQQEHDMWLRSIIDEDKEGEKLHKERFKQLIGIKEKEND